MTTSARQVAALVAKDLRIAVRTRHALGLVLMLGVLIVVVLGLSLSPSAGGSTAAVAGGNGAAAVLWVAYLFAGVLVFEKTMEVERHDGALAGLLLAPIGRGSIYAAKLAANLVLMGLLVAVVTLVGVLLFGFDLSAAPGAFALVTLSGLVGLAAVGTLFSALISSGKLQSGMLALLIFPINLPVVIACTQITLHLFRDGQRLALHDLGVLVAFDAIFLVVSWLVFELVLEP